MTFGCIKLIRFKYNFLLLIFSIYNHTYALNLDGKPASRDSSDALQAPCLATDPSLLIHSSLNNVNIQKAFIKYPFKKQLLDPDAELESKKIIQILTNHQIQFPILPWHEEQVRHSIEIRVNNTTSNDTKITLAKSSMDHQVKYEVGIKEGVDWHLLSADYQSPNESKVTNKKLLDGVFPSMKNCTPRDFYFDRTTKQSNNGILENNGYYAYRIDEYTAKYKIKEKFFNFDATEISIPSGTDSIYTVTVQTSAIRFARIIRNKTGYRLPVYGKKFKTQSAMAYLVPEGANKSTFVCFTFDGGF